MTARKTVLFDIDGTLVRLLVGRPAFEAAIERVWGIPRALEGVSFAGATDYAVARRIDPTRPRERLFEVYLEHLARELGALEWAAPLPGVLDLLDRLSIEGVRLALLTGNIRAGARAKLDRVGLWERFDLAASAFGDEGEDRREIALLARARAGGADLVVVGDSVADADAGRHIGARTILTATGPQSIDELGATGADHLLENLSDTERVLDAILGR